MGKFVQSPFYNSNAHLIRLFELLRKYHPAFVSKKLDKEKLSKKLFPEKPFDVRRMDLVMSRLASLVEQFLVARRLQREEFQHKKMLVAEYGERNLYRFFEKGTERLLTDLETMPYRDETYYKEKYEANLKYFGHPGTSNQIGNAGVLQKAVDSFDSHKKLTELKLECALNAIANTGSGQQVNGTEKSDPTKNPLFFLYEKLSLLQRSPEDEENMKILAEKFMVHIHQFRIEDRNNILKILLNFCTRFVNRGMASFSKVGFDLYKTGLENECLIFNNKISEVAFQNIITFGTMCDEFNWTKYFIEEYQNFLDENIRKDAVIMGLGQWHFQKGEYENVIELLNYSFKNPQDIFKSKSLLLRTWFEYFISDNSYYEMLINNIDAFEKYTKRSDKINERVKGALINFISYSRKILLAKMNFKNLNSIKIEVKEKNNIVLKTWLLEIIEKVK